MASSVPFNARSRSGDSSPPGATAGLESVPVNCWKQGQELPGLDQVAEETAVALVFNGISHVVMMASPRDLEDFALGFSLSEGIVERAEEVYGIELLEHPQGVELQLEISAQRITALKQRRRNLAGRTGCGLCGAESLQQAIRSVHSVDPVALPTGQALQQAIRDLGNWQPLQSLTGAFHGAAWCDNQGHIRLLKEDVGRHNALDKLIGALHRDPEHEPQGFVLVSSRASYEMVQKASAVGIGTLVAVSAPTSLAINMAREAGLNLVGFARPGRHVIYNAHPSLASNEQN